MKRFWFAFCLVLGLSMSPVLVPVAVAAIPEPVVLPADFTLKNDQCTNGKSGIQIALPFLSKDDNCIANEESKDGSKSAITNYLKPVLRFIGGTIVMVVVLVITYGGFEYITSIGDPKRVASAKDRIQNALIALVLFLMMYAILNFLVPGGLF